MKRTGFTFVEILVVVGVISILTTIILANMNDGSAQSRDTERKSEILSLQAAIERYKLAYGRYPDGCNGNGVWSSQLGTTYECSNTSGIYDKYVGSNQFVVGHEDGIEFKEYIPFIPSDPKLNGTDSGYMYFVNSEGTEYKLIAKDTIETSIIEGGGCGESATTLVVWGGFASNSHSGCDL